METIITGGKDNKIAGSKSDESNNKEFLIYPQPSSSVEKKLITIPSSAAKSLLSINTFLLINARFSQPKFIFRAAKVNIKSFGCMFLTLFFETGLFGEVVLLIGEVGGRFGVVRGRIGVVRRRIGVV